MGEIYKTLKVEQKSPDSRVWHVSINRPSRGNALSLDFFTEFPAALSSLDRSPDVGVIILSGAGKHFCSGIDLQTLRSTTGSGSGDAGRAGEKLRRDIKKLQQAVTAIEECRKPVIAAIHGACIGGGVDLVSACDLRYAAENAFFSVKEVDLGITADLGSLQRLPGIVGYGNAMELALTARKFSGLEAKELGLVTRVFSDKEALDKGVAEIALGIAGKSPLAVIGTKRVLIKNRDMTLDQGYPPGVYPSAEPSPGHHYQGFFDRNIISIFVYLAPVPTFIRIRKEKSTMGLFSAMLWMYYTFVKKNVILLISINSFGCVIVTL